MRNKALRVFLAVGLLLGSVPARPQTPAADPDVLKGIRQVDEGDYDAAILTLDAAARRLTRDPARAQEVAQAYLYLGVAYLGKGHEASARAQFREALARVKNLDLSPEKFAPKVIEAFEQARAESARGAAAPSPAPSARPASAQASKAEKKGGPGKGLLIGGLVLAGAGAGIAVAAGGGGKSSPSATGPTPDTRFTLNLGGSLTIDDFCIGRNISMTRAGLLEVHATWSEANVILEIELFDGPDQAGNAIARSTRTTQTSADLTFSVSARTYSIALCHTDNSCPEGAALRARLGAARLGARRPPCTATYSVTIRYP